MTSDDTNALTIKLLESNSYFGMEPSQVKILKQVAFYFAFSTMCFLGGKHIMLLLLVLTNSDLFQEKVACLADNDARLALDPDDKYKIQVANFDTIIINTGI